MSLNEIYAKTLERWNKYDPSVAKNEIDQMYERGKRDVLDKQDWGYYQFLPCLIQETKPKQIVELGGAMGVAALMMLSSLPLKSKLYSITLEEGGLEFSYIKKEYPNFVPIVGNDLDMTVWPQNLDLKKTDIWFFDSLHTTEQLTKELELYSPYFKKGAILLFDDIKMDEIWPVWLDLPYEKLDASILHFTGFGIAQV